MDIQIATIEDLKRQRPDLYQAIKQEVCLGELRLTKEDILALIEPLAEKIEECLKPYLSRLPRMTYNDIVDMENDIIDEVSTQLQNEFDELEEIVRGKPKRKGKRVVVPAPQKEVAEPDPIIKDACEQEETVKDTGGVKKGDAIRWNYTKDEGIVVGFENEDGISNIVVRRMDGTKVLFENDPKLFTILDGKEKDNLISKRKEFIVQSKESAAARQAIAPKKSRKAKTIYDGVMYDVPTRRGSKLKVGDRIRFKLTKDTGIIKGFFRKGGLDRILIGESSGLPESIIDNPEAYEIVAK